MATNKRKTTKKTTKTTSGEDLDDSDDEDTQVVTTISRKYNDETTEAITLAYEKDRSDHRKAWLMSNDKKKILPQAGRNVSIPNFINRELILFSYDYLMKIIQLFLLKFLMLFCYFLELT